MTALCSPQRLFTLGLVLLTAAGLALSQRVEAQQPDLFEVLIPARIINTPTNIALPDLNTLGKALARMSVYANGDLCTSADLTSATGNVVLTLGLSGQPAACYQDGAKVTFADGHCNVLIQEMLLIKNTRGTITNMAPYPPHGSPPSPRGCVPVPVATPLAAPPRPTPPTGGIAPPQLQSVTRVDAAPSGIRPPDTGDAGLAR